ncbi:MAG: iron-containing alcohol dehydrogenase [Victivallaceae bacterium]|nr:iron-containing alcohol dehydrogenase [Victivallaceae bacterium]
MSSYNLGFPGKIIFGDGVADYLPGELPPVARVLLAVGRHAATSGLAARLERLLKNFRLITFCGVPAEAPLSAVDDIIRQGRTKKVSAVVAAGGGSVIDAAKAAAGLIPLDGETADYFYSRKTIPGKGLFFAALPTTAGTGAEATPNAVLTDPETEIKKSLRHPALLADLAIIDPELTYSCPDQLTAHSGFDALTQAIESYLSRKANTVSGALAARAVPLIFNALPKACADPANRQARRELAEGSMITALAFAQSGLGAVHGLAHPLGSKLHVAHGLCCAILLPLILRRNQAVCSAALDELAAACGCADGSGFIGRIEQLGKTLGIPGNFRKFGFSPEIFPFVLKNCRSGSMNSNPRRFEDAEILEILETLL